MTGIGGMFGCPPAATTAANVASMSSTARYVLQHGGIACAAASSVSCIIPATRRSPFVAMT